MPSFLDMIGSLDREIGNILSEFDDSVNEGIQTKKNVVDSTEENVVSTDSKNIVDVTSKNFVSTAGRNMIQSPFIQKQSGLKSMTSLKKEGSSNIENRINQAFKF